MRSDLLLAIYFLLMVLFRFQLNPLKYLQMPIHSRKIHLECHHIQNGKKSKNELKATGKKSIFCECLKGIESKCQERTPL